MSNNTNNRMTNFEFKANLIVRGKIECLTGLHIGGSKEKLEIGGVDSIVIRSATSDYPYIPGSSLKGKMRHLLEFFTGAVNDPILVERGANPREELDNNLGNVSKDPQIVRLFGIGANERDDKRNRDQLKNLGLTRLLVRDAFPDQFTREELWTRLGSDAYYTEYKAENTIDRLTSAANPRFIERVVEESMFEFEMVYTVYDMNEDDYIARTNEDIALLHLGLRLLETSALGKSGSRGYGKIQFHLADPIWLHQADYKAAQSQSWLDSRRSIEELNLKTLNERGLTQYMYTPGV